VLGRAGNTVQILENTVLHLLPDNDVIIDDNVVVGPGAMIHGCRIGASSVIEPGAIVCDHSVLGAGCIVRAGAVVKQRSEFAPAPRSMASRLSLSAPMSEPPPVPTWALRREDLPALTASKPVR
jgi:carbonic anhydrase/acetyltransferase-like protein (isoleucine patch superfamily)